jgi:cytochrome c biogenesis protein ResB
MLTRLLFALRSFNADLGSRLGSWRLSVVLMVLAGFYYALLAALATTSPIHVVQNIAALIPFWLVYALLLINTLVCLWRRYPKLRRDLGSSLTMKLRPPEWELRSDSVSHAETALELLGGREYGRVLSEGDAVGCVRRRWSPLGSYLFHGAFFLIAMGFLLTILSRHESEIWVAVGEQYSGSPEQILSQSPPRILGSGMPNLQFRVEEIRPEFWQDQLLFTTLEADLSFGSGGDDRQKTTRINRPLWFGWGTFLRMSGFGYAPRYELTNSDGLVIDSAFIKLNVFPPGQEDYFSPGEYPHRIYVEVLPDFAIDAGEAVTRSLNLRDPAVVLQIQRGKLDLGKAVLRSGDSFTFEGVSLRFPEIRYWGQFSVVQDSGAPILFLGYLIGIAGLCLKLRGERAEIAWHPDATGPGGGFRGWGRWPSRVVSKLETSLRLLEGEH